MAAAVAVVELASQDLVAVAAVVPTTMTMKPPMQPIPSFAMVSIQHLPVMPTMDLSIPPRVVYYYYLVAAKALLPCNTEEEGRIDVILSHPVVA